ncbi:MAG: phenylalanine--tRNA ligase subunit beta [Candidatus Marsarchaeota archaeon]|nr:phenylalanine--tRNA ligase subunit beta [Candidatus Marsarchaeota archaeon]
MKFYNDDIKKHIGYDRFKDLVIALGMDIESSDDASITIDITPNRPDLLDFVGFMRAIKFIDEGEKPREYLLASSAPIKKLKVTERVKGVRPFIEAFEVRGADLSGNRLQYLINFTEKIGDTYGRRRKKLAIGLHDMDAIKGNLEYDATASARFMPLDSELEQDFNDIIKKHPKGIEYAHALAKKGNAAKAYPFLKDQEKILAMVPIINSNATKITEKTKNLFIDITGTDEKAIHDVAGIFTCSFIDSGAKVFNVDIEYGKKKAAKPLLQYRHIAINLNKVLARLGIAIAKNDMPQLLSRMGYGSSYENGKFTVVVPPYRVDVLNWQDVVEDIAIAIGYDAIEPKPIYSMAHGIPSLFTSLKDNISNLMIGMDFFESINTYLTNETNDFEKMQRKLDANSSVRIEYSKTEAYSILRQRLLPSLMQDLSASAHEKMPQKLFEIGSIFKVEHGNAVESTALAIVSEHSKANFAEVKGYVEALLDRMQIEYSFCDSDDPAFIAGRCLGIMTGKRIIGVFGEMHPQVLNNFKLEEPVVAAEITLLEDMKYLEGLE